MINLELYSPDFIQKLEADMRLIRSDTPHPHSGPSRARVEYLHDHPAAAASTKEKPYYVLHY